jgi:hypothetical protein
MSKFMGGTTRLILMTRFSSSANLERRPKTGGFAKRLKWKLLVHIFSF